MVNSTFNESEILAHSKSQSQAYKMLLEIAYVSLRPHLKQNTSSVWNFSLHVTRVFKYEARIKRAKLHSFFILSFSQILQMNMKEAYIYITDLDAGGIYC